MNKKETMVIRILVGLMMAVFGLNKFLNFMPAPEGMGEQMAALMDVFTHSPFMSIIGVLEILGGLGLILNKYVPLSLTILIAILFNAALFHLLLDNPVNAGGSIVFLILSIVLVYAHKERFSSLLSA